MAKSPYGRAVAIEYEADKGYGLGKQVYRHSFGEKGGAVPRLVKNANGNLEMRGGAYGYKKMMGTEWIENPPSKKFRHERKASPRRFFKGSLRTMKKGAHRIVIGCPRDHAHKFVGGRCIGGTRAQSVLHPKRRKFARKPTARKGVSTKMAKKRRSKGKSRKSHKSRARAGTRKVYRPSLHRVKHGKRSGWGWKRRSRVLKHDYVMNPPRRRRGRRSFRSHKGRSVRRHRARRSSGSHRRFRRNPDYMGLATSLLIGGAVGAVALIATKWLVNITPWVKDQTPVMKSIALAVGGAAVGAVAYYLTKNTTLAVAAATVPVAVALVELIVGFVPAIGTASGLGDDEFVGADRFEEGDTVIGDDGEEYVAEADESDVGFEQNVAGFQNQIAGTPLIMERGANLAGTPLIMER